MQAKEEGKEKQNIEANTLLGISKNWNEEVRSIGR